MKTFQKESIDMAMFSPPYWGLRDYGVEVAKVWGGQGDCEHEWLSKERRLHGGKRSESSHLLHYEVAQKSDWKTQDNFCVRCGAWKGQLGLEPHPSMYIDHMVTVCCAVKRVLKKSGSLYLNVGDIYFGGHSGGTDSAKSTFRKCQNDKMLTAQDYQRRHISDGSAWLQPKQLLGMPWRLAIALQAEGWILRNAIIWFKKNHMPSSVKDRLTNAYEFIFHFVKARRYFYDLDAIRKPHKTSTIKREKYGHGPTKSDGSTMRGLSKYAKNGANLNPLGKNPSDIFQSKKEPYLANNPHRMRQKADEYIALDSSKPMDLSHPKGKNPSDIIKIGMHHGSSLTKGRATYYEGYPIESDPKGKNPSDFWQINTKPFPQAHFAVYPEAICERPIKSSCPHAVCKKCAKPRTRITNRKGEIVQQWGERKKKPWFNDKREMPQKVITEGIYETVGWSDCGCNKGFDAGIVLDPMCGAGTTLVVAQKLGRRWIGIDLKADYVELAKQRLRKECSQKLVKWT